MKDDARIIGMMIGAFGQRGFVEHALKVYGYTMAIGGAEGLDGEEWRALRAAAILHDIGIPAAIEKHGSGAGVYQETEGAALVKTMLAGEDVAFIERVSWLVGHHHTEAAAAGDEALQVLMEADYLVNLSEGNVTEDAASVRERFFRTGAGMGLIEALFG